MAFGKKNDKFLNKLLLIAENLEVSAQYFHDFKINSHQDLKEFAKQMKEYENIGDDHIHELIVDLNKTFITPLEREDILQFAMKMDDVLDGMEQWSARVDIYGITEPDNQMIKFVKYILEAVKEIKAGTLLLSRKKLFDIRDHVIKINELETHCDDTLQDSIRELFAEGQDPIKIIQYKELYEMLEDVADSCEDVANTFETIIMRNA